MKVRIDGIYFILKSVSLPTNTHKLKNIRHVVMHKKRDLVSRIRLLSTEESKFSCVYLSAIDCGTHFIRNYSTIIAIFAKWSLFRDFRDSEDLRFVFRRRAVIGGRGND